MNGCLQMLNVGRRLCASHPTYLIINRLIDWDKDISRLERNDLIAVRKGSTHSFGLSNQFYASDS